jgi:hypothetical protein
VVSPYNKGVFATFMSDANVAEFKYAAGRGTNTIIGTADIYEGPLGRRGSRAEPRDVHVGHCPPRLPARCRHAQVAVAAPIQEVEVAKTGDRESGVLLAEGTLKVVNEAGIGVIADLFGLTAST